MKSRKFFIIGIAAVLSICFAGQSAWAGSKQRHRWEGIAIGLGAAMVGSALIHNQGGRPHYGPVPGFSFYYREGQRYRAPRHGKYRHHNPRHYRYGHRHHPRHYRHPGVHQHRSRGHMAPPRHDRHDAPRRHRR